jgi:hypothetical protein
VQRRQILTENETARNEVISKTDSGRTDKRLKQALDRLEYVELRFHHTPSVLATRMVNQVMRPVGKT